MKNTDNPVVTPRQRVINFEGIDNARDMGSLVMQDGRIVRFDMLVRSGKLAKATDADVATHGGYRVLLDELWEFTQQFNADMVILWEHMSCKALDGMHGLFEDRARELGINLVWVSHDLFDPRIISRQGVRDQINNYMRSVMREEPLDPSLEVLHDEESW